MAIDPGETTGWALFDLKGELIDCGQVVGTVQFGLWLDSIDVPNLIICEDYRINPKIPHGGLRPPSIEVIGMIRLYANRHKIAVKFQANRILTVGYAWAGIKRLPKSRHAESHQFDAIAHGVWYLQKNGIRKSALDETEN